MNLEQLAAFCKQKGIIFNNCEIYGGNRGFFDLGPLGVEIVKNIKDSWWKTHVQQREDVVGIDGPIISNPKVWKASGHTDNFADILVEDTVTNERYRADHLLEDALDINCDGKTAQQMNELIKINKLKSPNGNPLGVPKAFNLMFSTNVGPVASEESVAYLRPETAQLIFAAYKDVVDSSRVKLPFGIAQIGKAFRNEISPRNFIFRCREFEQMELEYFCHPDKVNQCDLLTVEIKNYEIQIWSSDAQLANEDHKVMKLWDAHEQGIIKTQWHVYWLYFEHSWLRSIGLSNLRMRARQHLPDEKSHYALDTWDIEYRYDFGWKELEGLANRTDYDLKAHIAQSKKKLDIFDEETKQKVIPHVVVEPSIGVSRALLAVLTEAYQESAERGNIILKLDRKLVPIQVAVFPLVNKVHDKAREVYDLIKDQFIVQYDKSGSVGKRYARSDETGVPICVTVDFEDGVTLRDRDTAQQYRVALDELSYVLFQYYAGKDLKDLAKKIEKND